MSLSFELNTDRPVSEVAAELCKGQLGPVKLSPVREVKKDFDGEWEHGIFSASTLDDESRDAVRQECGVRNPETRVWLLCKPRDPGMDEAVAMSVALLGALEGDLALLHGSGSVCFERVNGKLTLYRNELEERWYELFKPPYEIKPAYRAP